MGGSAAEGPAAGLPVIGPGEAGPLLAYGDGAVDRVPDLAAGEGVTRLLLVCGRRSFEASGAARILPELQRRAAVQRWSDFSPDPDVDELAGGLALLQDFAPDAILGVGGGSAMDTAKLLWAFAHVDGPDALRAAARSGAPATSRAGRLCLVPTTSGSGAEATHFAVLYLGDEKLSIAGASLHADTAVLDPDLTLSGSATQRATSGLDALCQAIESLWAVGATPSSRRLAGHALELVSEHLEGFVAHGEAQDAHPMALGSHLAGRAIDRSKTTAAHALAYGLTKQHGVVHGHAVALTLGAFLEAHARAEPSDLQAGVDPSAHAAAVRRVLDALGATDGVEGREALVALVRRLGLPATLSEVGVVSEEQRRALVDTVNVERLGNNPRRFDAEELAALLRHAG